MGNYRVVRKLAAGGMAEVFLGKLIGTGGFEKPVAIKRMLPGIASDPQSAEAFLREARLCVHLAHPNVVQVLDLGTSGGLPYLVMELVDGPDLRRVLNETKRTGRPLTLPESVHVAACVAEALAYAFEARGPGGVPLRIVHRDVNPTNVLLAMNGAVKLADFGVAKAADGREATQGNLVKGKLGYFAPELLAGVPAGHPSDIFLAGALLYEMLVGKPLFPTSGATPQILAAIASHDERTVRLSPGTSPELLELVRKAIAKDPAARFGHARELAGALRSLIAQRSWKVGAEELAARLAALFPGRKPLDADLGAGVALRDDRAPEAPKTQADRPAAPRRTPAPLPASAPEPPPRELAPARAKEHKRIGQLMIEAGLITEGQLQHLLARQRHEGGRLGEWAVTLDYAPGPAVLALLARQLRTPFITDERIMQLDPPAKLLAHFSQEMALRLMAVPLAEKEGKVFVAMVDPANLDRVDAVSFAFGRAIQPVVCSEFGLRRALSRIYGGRVDDLKWRQLDSGDPMAVFTARMVDFDEGGQVKRISEAGEDRAVRTPAPPITTPAAGQPVYGSAATPSGSCYAYVVAGIGPDGRPIFVPMAVTPQGIPIPAPAAAAPAGPTSEGGRQNKAPGGKSGG